MSGPHSLRCESVDVMFHMERSFAPHHRDDVEAAGHVKSLQSHVGTSGLQQVLLLGEAHGFDDWHKSLVAARFHLHEDHFSIPLCDDVHLPPAAAPIALVQGVTGVHQVARCLLLALLSQNVVLCHGWNNEEGFLDEAKILQACRNAKQNMLFRVWKNGKALQGNPQCLQKFPQALQKYL